MKLSHPNDIELVLERITSMERDRKLYMNWLGKISRNVFNKYAMIGYFMEIYLFKFWGKESFKANLIVIK